MKEIAKVIFDIVQRPADLVARYGGEEFAVILSNRHTWCCSHCTKNLLCYAETGNSHRKITS
ncbi:diguanylate cyclase domain-containing protein [Nostoc sp.]|uniref:diguanylate cyclase domain-containing protein n=1 Tax=Nostoc sp. TaxID=1180 RepID=UPI002FF44684